MSDIIQVADLEKTKFHNTFHVEAVTGKVGGLAGGADIDYTTNAVTGQVQKTLPKILADIDWSYVGLFADGVTFTKRTDFALDDVGIQWVYIGSYPFTATAGTMPSEPVYQVVHVRDHNSFSNRNAVGAHDEIYRRAATVAQVENGDFEIGSRLSLIDRDNGAFDIKPLGSYIVNSLNVLNAGVAKVAVYNKDAHTQPKATHLGAVAGHDSTLALNILFTYTGDVLIPANSLEYIVSDTLLISKNEGGKSTLNINSFGAKIKATTGTVKPWLKFDDTIKVKIKGLTSTSNDKNSFVETRGFWNSTIEDCFLENWVHYNDTTGFYRQSFFNEWRNSTLLTVDIHTGNAPSSLSEFNNNTFYNVNFLSTGPFLRIFGSHGVEGLRFKYCTAETQVGEMIYIDEQCKGEINFDGCYLDSENGGIPFDTKGLVINFNEDCDVPMAQFNSTTSLPNSTGRRKSSTTKTPYMGTFEPIGAVNYIKNGDLSENSTAMVLGQYNTAVISYDNVAINSKRCVINFDSNDACYLDCTPIKSSGYYSVIVIARAGFNVNSYVDAVSGDILFGTLNISGGLDTQVSTCTFYAEAGSIPKITFVSTADGNNLLLDYVCISHGKTAILGPLKSVENLSKLQQETGVVVANSGSIVKRFALSAFLRSIFTVDLYVEDFNAPDGVAYYKLAVTTSETSAALTVVDSVVSGSPVTFTISNQTGYFDILATPTNGECTIRYKTSGYYRNIFI